MVIFWNVLLWHPSPRWKQCSLKQTNSAGSAKALIWNLFMFHQTQLESNCIWFETFNCSCCFSLQIRKSWLSVKKKKNKNSRSWSLVSFQGFATLIAFCLILCPSEIEGYALRQEKSCGGDSCGFGTGGTHSGGCKPASLSPGLLWGANQGACFPASDLGLWLEGLESQSFLFALFIISDW